MRIGEIDRVKLRDAARRLMKATKLIRSAGLKQRMPQEPHLFLSDIYKLAMAMSAGNPRPDAKKQRKRTLRQMKPLEHTIARHARAHRDLLATHQAQTALSERQAQVILDIIDQVLAQLPAAIAQAHERIIGERPVPHAEKILSLYDDDVSIRKRGKAGAAVEFGNKLWLGETRAGLIIDYALIAQDQADTALVLPSEKRLYTEMKLPLQQVWGGQTAASFLSGDPIDCWVPAGVLGLFRYSLGLNTEIGSGVHVMAVSLVPACRRSRY